MKIMDILCRIIALLLLVSFVSCTSTPYAINFPQFQIIKGLQRRPQQFQLLQSGSSSQPSQQQPRQTAASPYWTGDGGRGKSITILPPRGAGLAGNQAYLPDFVANELVSNFNTFSAMTLFDRVNNQKQYDELLSGYYADDDKAGLDLGHLVSTDYMLLGTITKTSTGYALQLTVNKNSDKTTVASYSGAVSIAELDNLIGVRRASLDLLQKIGIQLTAQARTELTKAPTTDQVSAITAMAQGMIAQRQGNATSVAALTYFIQAAAFDASLAEAVSRTNVVSANISTGNIGANVRNDFAWSDSWVAKLTETETFINDMLRNTNPQRSIWYSNDIREEESARDRTKRTTELRIDAVLHTHAVFPVSMQRTVQAVYDGLQTTKRTEAWKLNGWPRQGVTNNNPFNKTWGGMIQIAFEVVNEKGQVIGRQTVEMDSRYTFNGTRLNGPGTAFTTVRFIGIRAEDITDSLSIRISSINGRSPEQAGISQIAPMSAAEMANNRKLTIYNGSVRPSSNDRNLGAVAIPAAVWGERVISIENGAFENKRVTSVTIPEGVTTIGDKAFANNHWTSDAVHYGLARIIIPNSVVSIGQEAFFSHWTTSDSSSTYNNWIVIDVTIGANVKLGNNAIGAGFETFYANSSKQSGIYKREYTSSSQWKYYTPEGWKAEKEKRAKSDKFWSSPGGTVIQVLGVAAICVAIYFIATSLPSTSSEEKDNK
jgi:hypothetical protein